MSESCLFCKIVEGQIPATIVHEDKHLLIFKDIAPQAKTHLLAIPKKHYRDFNEFSQSEDFSIFFEELSSFTKTSKELGGDFRLVSNCGVESGQTVFHVHFHLLSGEKLGSFGR